MIIKVIYKENKNYRVSIHMITDSKVDYRADENILSKIRKKVSLFLRLFNKIKRRLLIQPQEQKGPMAEFLFPEK